MTSRLMREAFMPSVPMEMPSETAIVLYSIGVPPAARMPALTRSDKRRRWIVARHHLDPGVGDAHERPFEVCIGEADGLQHRPRRSPSRTVGQVVALVFRIRDHKNSFSKKLLSLTRHVSRKLSHRMERWVNSNEWMLGLISTKGERNGPAQDGGLILS